ncbi:ParB-like protein [Paracoccus aminophilus]|nr:ParB-like protein [Paracoccus aminophilus]
MKALSTAYLHTVDPIALRPTQMTVGMKEVQRKRHDWREDSQSKEVNFLGHHLLPCVLGPKKRYHLIDNHHLALALHLEGVTAVLVNVVADLSGMEKDEFFTHLDNRNWLHPYDAEGLRHPHRDLPKTVSGMADDPYRSLSGALRRAGGYAKVETPFTEFLWADYMRRRIDPETVAKDDAKALQKALALAKSTTSQFLPGWAGVSES